MSEQDLQTEEGQQQPEAFANTSEEGMSTTLFPNIYLLRYSLYVSFFL